MFDFSDNYINRKAIKRALLEIDLETAEKQRSISLVNKQTLREHKTIVESESYRKHKFNNALSKPQTEAVDMKNFKDWRNINKPQTKDESPLKKKFSFSGDDDEGEQPEIDAPISTNKNDLISKIAKLDTDRDSNKEKDTSLASFFKEKLNTNSFNKKNNFGFTENPPKEEKVESKSTKISLNDLINKKREDLNNLQPKSQETETEQKIKVEIVDFNEGKKEKVETAKPKKTIKRKPRGKNKRKFDADVISSVDWK